MPITRRTFLGTAGAALTAGTILRADDEPPVRVAVIGTGARGSDLIRALTTIDAMELIAVCDDYPPHLEQGAKYAGPQAKQYADYRKLLDEVKPQAVVIAVPLYLHCSASFKSACNGGRMRFTNRRRRWSRPG